MKANAKEFAFAVGAVVVGAYLFGVAANYFRDEDWMRPAINGYDA